MPLSTLLLAYPGFNTLDLNGPLEILMNAYFSNQNPPIEPFTITIATHHEHTTAAENITIKRHISLVEAKAKIQEFDILIVPGAPTTAISAGLGLGEKKGEGEEGRRAEKWGWEMLDVVGAFTGLGDGDGGERVIMSVCTGALFLGYAGIFAGMKATTHFMALDSLRKVCEGYGERCTGTEQATVVPEGSGMGARGKVRYVDAGLNGKGVRVISSGGISCGLDASLYLVQLKLGREKAVGVAGMMEYAWREEK
jgi:putative intracellular protease/amidase